MSESDEDEAGVVARTFLFLVIDGDRPLAGGGRFPLEGVDVVLFCRGPERAVARQRRDGKSALVVNVQSPRVSQSHAVLRRGETGWLLEDLSSKNGTFINEHRLTRTARVRPGDVVRVGHAYFMLAEHLLPPSVDLSADVVDAAGMGPGPVPGFPTLSPLLIAELAELRAAIASTQAITIVGDTGTGKEELARAIHAVSRPRGPWKAINCATIPAALAEAQLFGYVKGAYSGAEQADPGFIRLADKGTLLLDEIPDLPLAVQAKLLRVLEEREVVPVGTARGLTVDVRFLAATQRRFSELVSEGKFRRDLKARLDTNTIELPPLRARREDLGLLIASLLARQGIAEADPVSLSPKAMRAILSSHWPENVRQLRHLLEAAWLRARDGVLDSTVFETAVAAPQGVAEHEVLAASDVAARAALIALFEKHQGKIVAVGREMGRSRQQVYRLVQRFGIDPDSFRSPAKTPARD